MSTVRFRKRNTRKRQLSRACKGTLHLLDERKNIQIGCGQMKEYENPTLEIISITEDIISTSFGGNTPLEDEEW